MFDPSLIDTEIYTETLTGDPSSPGSKEAEIKVYTEFQEILRWSQVHFSTF